MAARAGGRRSPGIEGTEESAVRSELQARAGTGPRILPVPVTELLEPRQSYYRRRAPAPVPADRERRRAAGAEFHRRWARHLAPPDQVEVRLEREGVVGVVDILGPDGPTELKTTGRLLSVDRLVEERASYIDQLGIYCALTGLAEGRLVVVGLSEGAPPSLHALRCRFGGLDEIRKEAGARAERYRRSLRSGDPGELPRCGWFGPRCPYRVSGACGCTGEEPADSEWVRGRLTEWANDPAAAARWTEAIASTSREPAPVLRSFSDLLWPRRAFFEQREPSLTPERPGPSAEQSEAYRALSDAVEGGPPGEVGRAPPPGGDPPSAIPTFRGAPYRIKVYRGAVGAGPIAPRQLPEHYLSDLGFRAAAIGSPEAWLFLSCLRAARPEERWRALRLRLADAGAWRADLESRRELLRIALASGDGSALPACPAWMAEACPYGARCGCPGASAPP